MSATKTRLPAEFADISEFQVAPVFERPELERHFAHLKDESLARQLAEAVTIGLHRRLKQAANEAAGLAWDTGYPLLVFPALFDELVQRERVRDGRQQGILARSEEILHAMAV